MKKDLTSICLQIYVMAGARGFFKGITARVLYAMPATAICWSTYEFFKFYLCGMDADKYKSSITGRSELAKSDYVLPKSDEDNVSEPTAESTANTTISKEPLSLHPPTTTTPPSVNASGAIKTVCELSTRTAAPTINLHTRHTEVKSPYERGFST